MLGKTKQIRNLFESHNGREVIQELAVQHFVFASPFVPNDPHTTAFNLGQQHVIMRIMHTLGMTGQGLEDMMRQENNAREQFARDSDHDPVY